MKKLTFVVALSIVISLCLSLVNLCYAQAQEQKIENQNSYVGLNVEKADPSTDVKQSIKNERSWFLINIVINGKVKECSAKTNNQD